MNTLSILIPVYNETRYFPLLLAKAIATKLDYKLKKEIIIVDDCSTDGTTELIKKIHNSFEEFITPYLQKNYPSENISELLNEKNLEIKTFFHEKNKGKDCAIQTAIQYSTGDIAIFQDADLEYDPKDYNKMLKPFFENNADVVYGSRFKGEYTKVLYYKHTMGNKFLTLLSNIFSDLNITDMETCYKMFKGDILRKFIIKSKRFGIEPEITAKIAKAQLNIFEVPVSYYGRTYAEGKKITWKDGFSAIWATIKFNLFCKKIFKDEGHNTLLELRKLDPLNKRIAKKVIPHLPKSGEICEIGSGIGNISQYLVNNHKTKVHLTDINDTYIMNLKQRFKNHPNVNVKNWDISKNQYTKESLDFVTSSNVLEHVENDSKALKNIYNSLKPGGKMFILVPAYQWLYCDIDKHLEHYRRYTKKSLSKLLEETGFKIKHQSFFNFLGIWGWLVAGKILKSKSITGSKLSLYNKISNIFFYIEEKLKIPMGLSVIFVAEKPK